VAKLLLQPSLPNDLLVHPLHAVLQGTAEVVFARKQDALKAVNRYDGVCLDGKPLKIEMLGTNLLNKAPMVARTVA
jgi:hypothetical protein